MITLTDNAVSKVKELLEAEGASDLALRVAVRPGGCSGFSYEMFFDGDVAPEDELATYLDDVKVVVDHGLVAAARRRHARLQGRAQPVGVLDHQPQRHPHLRLRAELLLNAGVAERHPAVSRCTPLTTCS